MAKELTYVLITPYSLLKSRTGGVIGRLLSLCQLELVGARMYAPSDAFVDAYSKTIEDEDLPPSLKSVVRQYVNDNFRKNNKFGISNRFMVLLFEGENAVNHLYEDVVGPISQDVKGNTIRGTYGDLVVSQSGEMAFFEPSILTPSNPVAARRQLRLLADHAGADGGILTNVISFPPDTPAETTLVVIKPDNFWKRSALPGNIIDNFSRTGLYIVAAKTLYMTVRQGEEFYRPVRQAFVDKLRGQLERRVREVLSSAFEFRVPDEAVNALVDALKEANAEHEFRKIVSYMTSLDADLPPRTKGRRVRCLALLYQGVDAIKKIRAQLGATDPNKADEGTVRSIYGQDLMKNGAHASDSPENAERERRIIGFWEEKGPSDVEILINNYLGENV
jgi:nucleoside diphosphate kinase